MTRNCCPDRYNLLPNSLRPLMPTASHQLTKKKLITSKSHKVTLRFFDTRLLHIPSSKPHFLHFFTYDTFHTSTVSHTCLNFLFFSICSYNFYSYWFLLLIITKKSWKISKTLWSWLWSVCTRYSTKDGCVVFTNM